MKITHPLISLIAANLVPVFGVVVLGWDVYAVIFLYWFETIVVLISHAAKTRFRPKRPEPEAPSAPSSGGLGNLPASKSAFGRYFLFLWGMGFTLTHGIFVIALIGPMVRHPEYAKIHPDGSGFTYDPPPGLTFEALLSLCNIAFVLGMLTIVATHVYPFCVDWKKMRVSGLMTENMSFIIGRIMLLHFTVLVGSFIMITRQIEHGMIYIFVGLKLAIDLLFFYAEKAPRLLQNNADDHNYPGQR